MLYYFYLEKLSTLSQRWRLREVALDVHQGCLYFSTALHRQGVEAALQGDPSDCPPVVWRQKLFVHRVDYVADDYAVPPSSPEFDEGVLLTFRVTGTPRSFDAPAHLPLPPRPSSSTTRLLSSADDGDGPCALEAPSTQLQLSEFFFGPTLRNDGDTDAEEDLFHELPAVQNAGKETWRMAAPPVPVVDHVDPIVPCGDAKPAHRPVTYTFRAPNFQAYHGVVLRLRQTLVRHGLCAPLHRGLPLQDPRNGLGLATVPLHLRHCFRGLNDVVFYGLWSGHAVYVRGQREVRGMEGYLCLTPTTALLLKTNGKCPRWVNLEDVVRVDVVRRGSRSFIALLTAAPHADLVFVPTAPLYPLCASFDAGEVVEGMVHVLQRLWVQRARAQGPPSPPKVSVPRADTQRALCLVRDLSGAVANIFEYIAQRTAGRELRWTPDVATHPPEVFQSKEELCGLLRAERRWTSSEEEGQTPRGDEGDGRETPAAVETGGSRHLVVLSWLLRPQGRRARSQASRLAERSRGGEAPRRIHRLGWLRETHHDGQSTG